MSDKRKDVDPAMATCQSAVERREKSKKSVECGEAYDNADADDNHDDNDNDNNNDYIR